MKETGIVRKIDRVGRVVIPKKLRWKYKLEYGDMVEIYTDQDGIYLKKYDMKNNVMDQVDVLNHTMERMEQKIKETKQLEEYLKSVKDKLEQFQ